MKRAPGRYQYRSGWCERPDEIRGVNGHRKCAGGACTCICHLMNAATYTPDERTGKANR